MIYLYLYYICICLFLVALNRNFFDERVVRRTLYFDWVVLETVVGTILKLELFAVIRRGIHDNNVRCWRYYVHVKQSNCETYQKNRKR